MKKKLANILLSILILFTTIGAAGITCNAEGDILVVESEYEQLSAYDLSSFDNWTSGGYTNYGPNSTTAYLRTNDYLAVDPDSTYQIELSNERITIVICEYRSDYTLICSNSYVNGSEFAPNRDAAYVGIYLKSTSYAKYSAYKKAFNDGLVISVSAIDDYDDSIEATDYTNTVLFKKGKYLRKGTGASAYVQIANAVSVSLIDSYKTVDPALEYVFAAPNDDYKLSLIEQNDSHTALRTKTVYNGDTYIPSADTSGVAVSIVSQNSSYTVEDILSDLAFGSISVYVTPTIEDNPGSDEDPDSQGDDPVIIEPIDEEEPSDGPIIVSPPIASTSNAHLFVENMKAGWNLGNTLDSHTGDLNGKENLNYEFVYGNVKTTQELLDYVFGCGFDTIRIPVSWSFHTYTDSEGHYHIYESWLKRVSEIVDMSLQAGFKVIVNSHHDYRLIYAGTDEESFAKVKTNTADIWKDVAEYFKDYDDRLLFESFNELINEEDVSVYSDLSARQCNELNQIFVDTVRSTGSCNAERMLVVPTMSDKYYSPFLEAYRLPKDTAEDKLIIEVHYYTTEFDQSMDYTFAELEKYSKKYGAPIIIGEYGFPVSYNKFDRATAYSNYNARAAKYGIKAFVWDNGNMKDYALINRKDYSASLTDIIQAIVKPTPYEGAAYKDVTQYLIPEKKLTQSTGAIVRDVWWGSMVVTSTDYTETIDPSAKYLKILCVNNGDAYSRNIHYVDFYDAAGNTIKMYSKGYPGFDFNSYLIPEGAASVTICINSSKHRTTKDEFLKYIDDGDLKLLVGYVY